jgi:hypothetical protein
LSKRFKKSLSGLEAAIVQQLSSTIQAEGNIECSQAYYADDLPSCWRSPLRSSGGTPGRMPGGLPGGGFPVDDSWRWIS